MCGGILGVIVPGVSHRDWGNSGRLPYVRDGTSRSPLEMAKQAI